MPKVTFNDVISALPTFSFEQLNDIRLLTEKTQKECVDATRQFANDLAQQQVATKKQADAFSRMLSGRAFDKEPAEVPAPKKPTRRK